MRLERGVAFALGSLLVAGACAPAEGPAAGPQVSPVTGEVYPEGTPPSQSRFAQDAQVHLVRAQAAGDESAYQEALAAAQAGIEAEPENPLHYYLAGQAYAGMGDYEQADAMWTRAQEIYPAYELEIEADRENAWVTAFNQAAEAYNAGNEEEAIRLWQQANLIYDRRPEAYENLAVVYIQSGDYERAIEMYEGALEALERRPVREVEEEEIAERAEARRNALTTLGQLYTQTEQFAEAERVYREILRDSPDHVAAQSGLAAAIARQGRAEEAAEMYDRLLSSPDLTADDLMAAGVGLFQAEQYELAAQAFERITEQRPQSRDAWFNYLNALYAQDENESVIRVGERLLELDPLNENAYLIIARAHRDAGQPQRALQMLERAEALPVTVTEMQLSQRQDRAELRGQVQGNQAAAGTPVRLQFTFYGEGGELGTETVTVNAPAEGATTSFTAAIQTTSPVTGYSYRVLE